MFVTKKIYFVFVLIIVLEQPKCRKPEAFAEENYDTRLSAGLATAFSHGSDAYGLPFEGLSQRDAFVHALGDINFESSFVTEPSTINEGLGDLYNNVSCVSCHHLDARGFNSFGENNSSMLMRISIGNDPDYGPIAASGFGQQLQDKANYGKKPECKIELSYAPIGGTFPDGESYVLYNPVYNITQPYTALPSKYFYSPRLSPSVFGLGLLENIDEQTILDLSDENDDDNDGISGKANFVYDPYLKKKMLGRFGHKANTATILTQVAAAYNQDMGITNYVFPIENSEGQEQFSSQKKATEIDDTTLNNTVFYIKTLSVPARRNVTEPDVIEGQKLFNNINCSKCHIPSMTTKPHATLKQLSNQKIQAFTDLLVHDMGDGLADYRDDFLASGKEWRTTPLWGIGLLKRVNGVEKYLHDGRANSLNEAILWHGGEAEKSKEAYKTLQKKDRQKLIKFLQSL